MDGRIVFVTAVSLGLIGWPSMVNLKHKRLHLDPLELPCAPGSQQLMHFHGTTNTNTTVVGFGVGFEGPGGMGVPVFPRG
jgi:hypothetical protein